MKILVKFYISIPCTNCPSLIFQIEYLPKSSLLTYHDVLYTANSPIADYDEDDDKMS